MAGKRTLGQSGNQGVQLYVIRAVEDSDDTRIYEATPEELVMFDGYEAPVTTERAVYFSGYCRGATRQAGGHGSIIGYQIAGTFGGFEAESDASGIVLPLSRPNPSVPTWQRSPKLDVAYIVADVANTRLQIVTTKTPITVNEDGIIGVNNVNDGLSLGFDDRNLAGNTYNTDDGTIPFEDFIFYGNYKA